MLPSLDHSASRKIAISGDIERREGQPYPFRLSIGRQATPRHASYQLVGVTALHVLWAMEENFIKTTFPSRPFPVHPHPGVLSDDHRWDHSRRIHIVSK
ncbi:unnamed protein product, partial [Timema podura]|nr:unnamed protein product [Timema podura]